MSVAEAQARIDSSEFSEWMILAQESPLEPERTDLRFAYLTAHVLSVFCDKPFKISDVLPPFAVPDEKSMTDDDIGKRNEAMMTLALGAATCQM